MRVSVPASLVQILSMTIRIVPDDSVCLAAPSAQPPSKKRCQSASACNLQLHLHTIRMGQCSLSTFSLSSQPLYI